MRIGIDIQNVRTISKMERFFTGSELDYLKNKNNAPDSIMGLYAAKEAFFKAIKTGIQKNQLLNVEILHEESGAPYINLLGELKEKHSGYDIHLSISHTKSTAVAVCIMTANASI